MGTPVYFYNLLKSVTNTIIIATVTATHGPRELAEEMGIRGVTLDSWGTFYCESHDNKVWGALYSCRYDGPLTLQTSEVEYVLLMSPEEIRAQASAFMPDSVVAFEQWLTRRAQGE